MHPKASRDESAAAPETPVVVPFVAPLGGVFTREVGTITGDLEVWLDPQQPWRARVRYVGALDVYTVRGSAKGMTVEQVVEMLTRDLGIDEDGNPESTDLRRARGEASKPSAGR